MPSKLLMGPTESTCEIDWSSPHAAASVASLVARRAAVEARRRDLRRPQLTNFVPEPGGERLHAYLYEVAPDHIARTVHTFIVNRE